MSNQNKAKTRDELIDKAADAFYATDPTDVDAFTAGAKWADQNPPPEVQGLLDALARIKKGDTGDTQVPYAELQRIASAALETYRKVTSKE